MDALPATALMASLALPSSGEAAAVPDWVHLLPAGEVRTRDGRGPYRYDPAALMAASLGGDDRLVIDQDHATDLAAPKGHEAPARGWIVALEAREDGVWGRVEWTAAGRALLADRAYRGLSPVIGLDRPDGRTITTLLRASLVNAPNLRGLTALHSEQGHTMEALVAKLKGMLGLGADAEEHDIWRSLQAVLDVAAAEKARDAGATALQSQLAAIGAELGVEGGDGSAILVAAKAARAGTGDVVALQSRLTAAEGELATIRTERAREASEAFVDAEMARGRVGLNATTRPDLVALHMAQPDAARRLIDAMPVVGPGAAVALRTGAPEGGAVALNADQAKVAKLLGIPEADFAKVIAADERKAA